MDVAPIVHDSKAEAEKVYSAFLRVFWVYLNREPNLNYPSPLTKPRACKSFKISGNFPHRRLVDLKEDYLNFFLAQDEKLLVRFCHLIEWAEEVGCSSFTKNWLLKDLALLSGYSSRLRNVVSGRLAQL